MDHIKKPQLNRPEALIGALISGFEDKVANQLDVKIKRYISDYLKESNIDPLIEEVVITKQGTLIIKTPALIKRFLKLRESRLIKLIQQNFPEANIRNLK